MNATTGATEVVENVGVTGSLAVVILLMVGAVLYLVASARKQIDSAVAHAERAAGQASAANSAVNNIGPGEHRMYDKIEMIRADIEALVAAQEDFAKRGWQSLPPDLATSSALTSTIRDLQHADKMVQHGLDDLSHAIAKIDEKITNHVKWEESQKYPPQGH